MLRCQDQHRDGRDSHKAAHDPPLSAELRYVRQLQACIQREDKQGVRQIDGKENDGQRQRNEFPGSWKDGLQEGQHSQSPDHRKIRQDEVTDLRDIDAGKLFGQPRMRVYAATHMHTIRGPKRSGTGLTGRMANRMATVREATAPSRPHPRITPDRRPAAVGRDHFGTKPAPRRSFRASSCFVDPMKIASVVLGTLPCRTPPGSFSTGPRQWEVPRRGARGSRQTGGPGAP